MFRKYAANLQENTHFAVFCFIARQKKQVSITQISPETFRSNHLKKSCSENMQQIYRRILISKCVLNKICCIFSEHLSLRTLLEGYFCTFSRKLIITISRNASTKLLVRQYLTFGTSITFKAFITYDVALMKPK